MNINNHLFRAIFAPIIFEMCGIIPVILVALGLLSAGAGIALRNVLVYQYTFVFFIIAAGFFVYSVYVYLKKQNSCNLAGLKKHRLSIVRSIILLTIIEAILLALLQIIEGKVYGQSQTRFTDFITIGTFLIVILIGFIFVMRFMKIKNEKI